jgi:hypothetical protein
MARQLRVEYAQAIYNVRSLRDRLDAIFWYAEERGSGRIYKLVLSRTCLAAARSSFHLGKTGSAA